MLKPEECQNLAEVRNCIDSIDKRIIELLVQRFGYVKEVVKYKSKDSQAIIALDRYNQVLKERGEWAEAHGLNAETIRSMYKILLDYFIAEEMQLINKKNNSNQ